MYLSEVLDMNIQADPYLLFITDPPPLKKIRGIDEQTEEDVTVL